MTDLTVTFDLVFSGGRGITIDYPCAKFGDFSFSRFGFITRIIRQNQTHTHTDAMTAVLTQLPSVGIIQQPPADCYRAGWIKKHVLFNKKTKIKIFLI